MKITWALANQRSCTNDLLKICLLYAVKNIDKESKFAKAISIVMANLVIFTLPGRAWKVPERMLWKKWYARGQISSMTEGK